MDPAALLLLLKSLLTAIPLITKQIEIFRTRGEYTDAEWNEVKALVAAWKADPAWQEEPDPTGN